jgi:hypothetical protein
MEVLRGNKEEYASIDWNSGNNLVKRKRSMQIVFFLVKDQSGRERLETIPIKCIILIVFNVFLLMSQTSFSPTRIPQNFVVIYVGCRIESRL